MILDDKVVNSLKAKGTLQVIADEEIAFYDEDQKRFVLKSGKVMDRDINVLCSATGFRKSYSWFDEETLNALDLEGDGLYLYHQILPINVDRIAFIGSEVSSFNNVASHFMQSEWLRAHFQKQIELDPVVMEQQVNYLQNDEMQSKPDH